MPLPILPCRCGYVGLPKRGAVVAKENTRLLCPACGDLLRVVRTALLAEDAPTHTAAAPWNDEDDDEEEYT